VSVLVATLLLVAGAVLLTAGAEAFAEHVSAAADRLGVSVVALALLVAGAEPEEAVTAMLASGQGHPALAAGDAIGANLVVLTLALGAAALLGRLPVTRRTQEYAVASCAAGALAWLLLRNGVLGRGEGVLLLAAYAVAVGWVWRRERHPPVIGELAEVEGQDPGEPDSGRPLLMVLLGVVGMVAGGALAVRGATDLVGVAGLRESVVGLTLLALVTSAEMFALVVAARRRGLQEVVVAGAVGAVAYNATVTLGLAAVVDPLLLGRQSVVIDVAALTAALPLVLLTARRGGALPRAAGAALLAAYAVALVLLLAR
jgi:cation:H+ antiporter